MSATLTDERVRLRRGRVVTAAVLVALLVGAAVVWRLGGFGYRQDLFTKVEPGTLMTSGPFEITFTTATVQHATEAKNWEVAVTGTARTTGDITITPASGDGGFLFAQNRERREVQPADAFDFGASDSIMLGQDALTPGLPAVPFTARFDFDGEPADTVRVVVFGQEYGTKYVLSDEKGWQTTSNAYELTLPLRRLADKSF